jgi:hypothetical protein
VLGVVVVTALGACSNIIGISSYEIDPSLDQPGAGGSSSQAGAPETAGAGTGGTDNVAGGAGGEGGTAGAGGEGGASTPTGCSSSKDCDDTIDCTTDTCLANGTCGHAPQDTLCDSTRCETCTVGIGCVAGPKTQTQILLDPSFDIGGADWDDSGSDAPNLVTNAMAQSGSRIAKFGPVAQNATKYQYDDLLQYVTLPAGVSGLTLTGYYKLTPTAKLHPADPDDYVAIGFYDLLGGVMPVVQFHSFDVADGAQATWKAFTYDATAKELATVTAGGDYSFDFVGHVFSAFQFDTMTLTATVCQ